MTCKDCIHYDVCDGYKTFDVEINHENCREFKDKSLFIELPCHINDIVFVTPTISNGLDHITQMECLGFQISKPNYTADLFRKENGKSHKMYNAGFDMFGDTVFFTKEEAEAKLKELEQNNA